MKGALFWVLQTVAFAAWLSWAGRPAPSDPPGLFHRVETARAFIVAAGSCETEEGKRAALAALRRLLRAE